MFVRVEKQQDLIRFPEEFFTLTDVNDDGNLEVSVEYKINQSDVVNFNALQVRISVSATTIKDVNIVMNQPTAAQSNDQIVKNILNYVATIRSAVQNNANYLVTTVMSDNTAKVNNEALTLLKTATSVPQILSFARMQPKVVSVQDLNTDNFVFPILQVNAPSQEQQDKPTPTRHLLQNALIKKGIDPSDIFELDGQNLMPHESIHGVSSRVSKNQTQFSDSELVEYYRRVTVPTTLTPTLSSTQLKGDQKIITLTTVSTDEVTIEKALTLHVDKIKNFDGSYSDLFLKFEVLDNNGISIQTDQKRVNVSDHLNAFYTPKVSPIAHINRSSSSNKGNLLIKQLDPISKSVQVFKKNLFYAVVDPDFYTFVGEYPCDSSSGVLSIPVDASNEHTIIYRVIPVGPTGIVGSTYTNAVIRSPRLDKRFTYVSITTRIIDVGINVEIREVPADVVSLRVLRRDATINESDFSIVSTDMIQVDPNNASATYITVDTDVKSGHMYEYACQYVYKSGDQIRTGLSIIEFLPLVENFVATTISNVLVNYDINNLDVSFNINSTINDSDLDVIKNLLERQGLDQFFTDDIKNERDKLKQLIAHQVYRVDLTTGERENFGVVTDENFSDINLRTNNSVQPLKIGHNYRYEVSTLLRFSETLFSKFVKTSVDPVTKKSYTFSPFKFLHPITLTLGNITTESSLSEHYPKSQMSFGNVGNLSILEASFAQNISSMLDASAEVFEDGTNLVRWKIKGSPSIIDHFLIIKECIGLRTLVGRAHSNLEKTAFQFIHQLSSEDMGELFYVIVPIFNTYTVGTEIKTNGVIVE